MDHSFLPSWGSHHNLQQIYQYKVLCICLLDYKLMDGIQITSKFCFYVHEKLQRKLSVGRGLKFSFFDLMNLKILDFWQRGAMRASTGSKMFQGVKYSREQNVVKAKCSVKQSVLRGKVCLGAKWVRMQSVLEKAKLSGEQSVCQP